ncbi:hypothetical protein OG792_01670 [Micromonospora sp. NBC_01699]|nr:hypothetical protein [Micromonospora sp. NBC_01699]
MVNLDPVPVGDRVDGGVQVGVAFLDVQPELLAERGEESFHLRGGGRGPATFEPGESLLGHAGPDGEPRLGEPGRFPLRSQQATELPGEGLSDIPPMVSAPAHRAPPHPAILWITLWTIESKA